MEKGQKTYKNSVFKVVIQKPGKTIKIVVSAQIAQNLKCHLFLEKGAFWHG